MWNVLKWTEHSARQNVAFTSVLIHKALWRTVNKNKHLLSNFLMVSNSENKALWVGTLVRENAVFLPATIYMLLGGVQEAS